jgi:hypothetical protein
MTILFSIAIALTTFATLYFGSVTLLVVLMNIRQRKVSERLSANK